MELKEVVKVVGKALGVLTVAYQIAKMLIEAKDKEKE